uniref:Uncharacterized protein n=1 Tax=Ovis aries TaxID=9940 RepID=A0AC11BCP4_SHEEP
EVLSSLRRVRCNEDLLYVRAVGLVEAGQDETDQVERKGLRLDNRKDLALRSASFKFQINSHRKRQWAEHRACFRRAWSLQDRMAQELSEKELLKMEVEQLKKEVKNPRAPISKTGKEIKDYVEAEAGNDPLLKGIPEDKNPFKEKGGCMIS